MDDESLFFHLRVGEKEPYITIDDSVLLLQMANRIQRNNSRIKEQLLQDLNNGIKVAIHGATNGLNCILFLNQLQNHPNLEIFDGDSSKADKFLPAFEKPIIDAKSPKYKSFSKVYISATGFYQEIHQFLTDYHGFQKEEIFPLFPKTL